MSYPGTDTWQVTESGFPAAGTPSAKLQYLLKYAVLAPSGHNTQPWRFHIARNTLELYADRTRALPIVDPQARELHISCGAALFNLRMAIRHFGHAGVVAMQPDPDDPDLLARVGLGERSAPSTEEELLFQSIPNRHTNRMSFGEHKVAPETLEALVASAEQEDAWLWTAPEGETREALADLIVEADRDQLADSAFRHELAAWVHSNYGSREDGMPGSALGMPGLIAYAGPFMVRTFDTGAMVAARDRQLVIHSPLLIVLGTEEDTPADWLKVGQALERVLLRATSEGVSASFLNSPIELPAARAKVREVLGVTGHPQLILRLGFGPEMPPTPRRRVDEVLTTEP
jgi:nitroreductase